ncbi:MAG: 2-amino-4-hydroxy-6-hydroxymethyldihydropteridine diphosphokinase [Muribaculaceae bacterium]|nr:2-amino-4-hydroxy-6-hydroxymethyldihydropteridine diphosphokinase [Muribaculaceae bacterium]
MKYYLNLGTNLGHKRRNLFRAIAALSAGCGGCMVSRMVESEPWGFHSPHAFLNVGVAITTAMPPHEVLSWLHDIERRLGSDNHRDEHGHYADRLIDIDIMAADDDEGNAVTLSSATLQIPHPHLHDRMFFLQPYRQLKP